MHLDLLLTQQKKKKWISLVLSISHVRYDTRYIFHKIFTFRWNKKVFLPQTKWSKTLITLRDPPGKVPKQLQSSVKPPQYSRPVALKL